MKFKVVVPHPKPEAGKKYSKTTVIYCPTSEGEVMKSDHTVLMSKSAHLVPSLSSVGVWFMGENQFGISLKADVMFCKPVVTPTPLESLRLKRKYTEVTSEDANKMSKNSEDDVAEVSLTDEDGCAM